ncbi:Leucine rich repeat-containing protein [Ruminococcus albus]|uniref:Leucine rich repeat-containing protein n=2 Tax=Ruminococcus albus TaxID=1264 RepID=A0A1I1EGM4_RUMAL|nr:Leucine rich repeat-containing protein [Ruminococcus albus]
MPSSLRELSAGAFANTSIKEIELPEGMTKIDDFAFAFSYQLEKVTLPDSIEEIDEGAFYSCPKLKEINVPEGLKKIRSNAFVKSGLSDEQKQAFFDKAEEVK